MRLISFIIACLRIESKLHARKQRLVNIEEILILQQISALSAQSSSLWLGLLPGKTVNILTLFQKFFIKIKID